MNMVVAALMIFGGVQEAIAYWGVQALNVVMGTLGAAAAASFFASGLAVWNQKGYARTLTALSCVAMIAVHLVSAELRFLGVAAMVVAITYPAVVLLSVWRKPNSAVPVNRPGSGEAMRDDHDRGPMKRVAAL
jgi:hypothetical protein